MTEDHRRLVVVAGTANVVLHGLGLVLALIALRPGAPVVPLDRRVDYLSAHPAGWTLGWGVWILCALAVVAFLASLRPFADPPGLGALALKAVLAGAAMDLACDVGQIVILPDRAGALLTVSGLDEFLLWERRLAVGGLVFANGLYSIAVLLAAVALRRVVPWHALLLGLATFAAGMLLAWTGCTGDMRFLEPATALTFVTFLPWTIAVTRAIGGGSDT